MVKESNTINEMSATQKLHSVNIQLENLLNKLEQTENESKDLIQFAYDTHSVTLFNNYVYHIQFQLKRIYYNKNKKDGKNN